MKFETSMAWLKVVALPIQFGNGFGYGGFGLDWMELVHFVVSAQKAK